ncbi:hypothetical protein QZH41_011834 [Actinostola sp. cb2023]|nr:hypothetical protein QZH41_011834 [Actinostola sp. cb2023]
MYSMTGEYPESPAESEESITDESPDTESPLSQVSSPYGTGRGGGGRGFPSRRESTAEKQRKWAVRTFTLWLTAEGVSKPMEEMHPQELNQQLKKFYKQARRKDGCDFSKPGLTNIRNALDRYIKTKLNFTILKSVDFEEANKAFDEKISMIEGNAASPWRHSVSISPQDMQKILVSGAIGGSAPLMLLRACWFNILLHFDVGDHLKQRRLSKQQFVIHMDAAGHEHVKMINCFPYEQGKFGMAGNTSSPTTMHSVPGHPLCPVALLKKYLSKLHPEADALFQCPVQYAVDDSVPVWYEKQAVGVHALEGMMSCLSKEAACHAVYSNGCLRKSSSLVYLQCGFGCNPRNNASETSVSTASNSIPSSSGMASSFTQSSPDTIPQLPSPSTSGVRSISSGDANSPYFSFSPDNKQHVPSFPTQTGLHQASKYENMTNSTCKNPTFPQISNSVSLAKNEISQNSKRPNQHSFSHTDVIPSNQSRTAIGVCMPTIKMEEGVSTGTTMCDGSSMGVQPTFPSESIDFPSVTEAMAMKRDLRIASASSNVREASSVSSAHPPDVHTKTYLYMAVLGGKSFIEFEHYESELGQQHVPCLNLHVHFRGQRFKSKITPCTIHPSLKEDFYLELHHSPSADSNTLLNITDPISLILSKTEANGNVSLIGSHCFDWQKVLKEPNGVLAVTVDVNGMGEESKMMIGALEMKFQVLTTGRQVVQPHVIDSHLSNIHSRASERERRFMGYARQWWKDYMSGHLSHSRQQVKIFAQNECGASKPVVSFITPIDTGHLLDTPRHAAIFVSLLKHEDECSMFGSRVDSWTSLHAFLCRGKGSCEDHAILLCSILLGFGLNASVCLGTKDTGQPHAWVMTRQQDGRVVFWESLTGQCHDVTEAPSAECPHYRTLGCIFSNSAFYANIQESGLISQCDFDVMNSSKWKAMESSAIYAVCGSDIQGISLAIQWDDRLSHILSPCLVANEHKAKTGHAPNLEELREPVYTYLTNQMSFQSVTTCINHVNVSQAIANIQTLTEFQALIDYNEDHMEFALRVHVFPYPENVCTVWIILAAKYPVTDGEPTYQWKTVSLQSQVL